MSLMKDNFVKLLIIYLFHTILITFLTFYEMTKTSYDFRTDGVLDSGESLQF